MSLDELYTPEERAEDAAKPDPLDRSRILTHGRMTLSQHEEWIGEEFARVNRELAQLRAIKRDKRQPKVFLETPAEVLKAFELNVLTKSEARKIMGLKATRQPAQLRGARKVRA
jgi:hypothetical protein